MAETDSLPISILFTVLALIFVLILAWLAIKLLAQTSKGQFKNGRIELLESRGIGTRERLVLIRYNQRDILLGVTGNGISVVENSPANTAAQPEDYEVKSS